MGYRSDVLIAIGIPSPALTRAFIAEQVLSNRFPLIEWQHFKVLPVMIYMPPPSPVPPPKVPLPERSRLSPIPGCVVFAHFEDSKWYDDYDDVRQYAKMLSEASRKYPTRFLRIGEEPNDVVEEHLASCCDGLIAETYSLGDGVFESKEDYLSRMETIDDHMHSVFAIVSNIAMPMEPTPDLMNYIKEEKQS